MRRFTPQSSVFSNGDMVHTAKAMITLIMLVALPVIMNGDIFKLRKNAGSIHSRFAALVMDKIKSHLSCGGCVKPATFFVFKEGGSSK